MVPKEAPTYDNILEFLGDTIKDKKGIVCLNSFFIESKINDIIDFMKKRKIPIPQTRVLPLEYLKIICLHFYHLYNSDTQYKKRFRTILNFIGESVCRDDTLKFSLQKHDIIAKQSLIDVFSEFKAIMGHAVYDTRERQKYSIDLFLLRRRPTIRTEAIFSRTGDQMGYTEYNDLLAQIEKSYEIAEWTTLLTTPLGLNKIGLKKLISDMKRLNSSLYVIDPYRKRILGILKGKKNKNYDNALRNQYIKQFPKHSPKQETSRFTMISKYDIKDADSFNPKDFIKYDIVTEIEHDEMMIRPSEKPIYTDIFKNLIIVENTSGVPIYSLKKEKESKQELISEILIKMDSIVSQMEETSSLLEMEYKGLFILANYGQLVKIVLFLSEPAYQSLKERLSYFVKHFEKKYLGQITDFSRTRDKDLFDDEEL